ncbi:hypothetical protein [Paenibacillus roseipurpureus]|uniref:Uncharacterized protein n=1 Tax=Paenibacillus roseopurpureus TaxID=2918901 RepID=A0AA96RLP0_9BACL|nr:hypothetical protein [Paenibacillus sp. MBLB1832]WNR43402.1 hypothetical protein MJB10_20150 [Paenibacillus sp. MBLB1832]
MRLRDLIVAIAVCFAFLCLAYQAETPHPVTDPNPMKQNQEQFARMQEGMALK